MRYVCLWSPGWSIAGEAGGARAEVQGGEEAGRRSDEGAAVSRRASQTPIGGIGADLAVVLPAVLAELAPRVRVEPERVWVDARGLPAEDLAVQLLESLDSLGVEDARAGVSDVAVAAWAACSGWGARALGGGAGQEGDGRGALRPPAIPPSVFLVPPGREREYLSGFPLLVLAAEHADPHVLAMLEGVGVQTCGQLAALEREAVEVRFGTEGVRLWRLARSDDPRLLFQAAPPELPQASLDFLDYVVTDPERLAFTVNALLGSVCDALRERGQHARRMLLVLELSGGGRWEQGLRPGRPTGSRTVWLRLARAALDRSTLGDAVAGVGVQVEAVEPAGVRQGDLFDAGFATAPAVEAAVLRLLESQGEVVVRPEADAHPLAERRLSWRPVSIDEVASVAAPQPQPPETPRPPAGDRDPAGAIGAAGATEATAPAAGTITMPNLRRSWAGGLPLNRVAEVPVWPSRHPAVASAIEETAALTLQLLKQPRAVRVETVLRRDHEVPIRYRDDVREATGGASTGAGRWQQIVSVAGPDRVSGGVWEEAYAREYFRATTSDGALVWLFRDARRDSWYLHGWWD